MEDRTVTLELSKLGEGTRTVEVAVGDTIKLGGANALTVVGTDTGRHTDSDAFGLGGIGFGRL